MHCAQNCTKKSYIVLKTVQNSSGASDKGKKRRSTSGCPADPKFSENVCY